MSLRARLSEHLEERTRNAIYSSLIVLAVIVALDDEPVRPGEALSYVVGTAVATALAELYADYIGTTIRTRRRPTRSEWRAATRNVAGGVIAALLPATFLVLSAFDAIGVQSALEAAKWTGAGLLGTYAFLAHRLAGMTGARSAVVGLGFTLIGVFLVLLKAAVH